MSLNLISNSLIFLSLKRKQGYLKKKNVKVTYMFIPNCVLVVYKGCTKTSSRVDASPCNRNCSQVHQKDSKTNRQRCQYLIHSYLYYQIDDEKTKTKKVQRREKFCLLEHGSLQHFSLHRWQRRQCKQAQMYQESLLPGQTFCCSLERLNWHHHPASRTGLAENP